ncbi:hypothetical protein [Portibacter lacus]|uniref:Uncharacterized protein n=1 Tax=Portibacter lacus TaxID=1099794 RepID=A0AA37SW80_9BACT|nr:hypothetical protein [Portibacter lacus]GLR19941.1 hypothetical protein GCM10007940_45570 [Portibacter lacus]
MIYVGIGYLYLMMDVNFRYIVLFGVLILLSNVVFEYWITVLNTPDIIDSYFGYAGTLLAFLFLFVSWKIGMMDNPLAEKEN